MISFFIWFFQLINRPLSAHLASPYSKLEGSEVIHQLEEHQLEDVKTAMLGLVELFKVSESRKVHKAIWPNEWCKFCELIFLALKLFMMFSVCVYKYFLALVLAVHVYISFRIFTHVLIELISVKIMNTINSLIKLNQCTFTHWPLN